MKKVLFLFGAVLALLFMAPRVLAADLSAGDLIKASQPAVYYYGADGKRYVFPNEKTYKTWYDDFSTVKTITDAELAAISIGGNATYKPGVKMVKITTDPKVYAVSKGGNLRWIKTEALAISLYGAEWNKKIEDVPDAFFTNYLTGSPIESEADYSVSIELAETTSINADKGISVTVSAPPETPSAPPAPTFVWNIKTINEDAYYHRDLSLNNFYNGFFTTWYDDRNGQNEVYYQTTDLMVAGSGAVQRVSSNITDSTNPKSVYDGANLYFLWEDSSPIRRAVYSQKNDLDGNKIKFSIFASTTYATSKYPDIAWNEPLGEYGVVWWDTRKTMSGAAGDLYFSLMTKGGSKAGAELAVTAASASEFMPKIISADDKFAVLWQGDDSVVKIAKINEHTALSGSIKDAYVAGQKVEPKIAWNGNGFGMVWAEKVGDNQDIYFLQLDSSGNKVGDKIALTSGAGDAAEPDILWNGDKFYVAYTNYKPNALGAVSDVRIAKIDSAGVTKESAVSISSTGVNGCSPSLAKSNGTIAAAWLENGGSTNKIMGAVERKQ